ncbi:alpha/beta fold hydrolase [Pseudonocardia xishanensis]|uniref:Esterase FrsA n=1 Tax=Pseudonocardia xishanensis TaxID=630995 RepID=A0ABP8RHE1_9PSEU
MTYQWPIDPADLFAERHPQMVKTGLPPEDIENVRSRVARMWADEPGGWVYEWSALGERYADRREHERAVLAFGWARFPAITDEHKRAAYRRQLEEYALASPNFPVGFERRVVDLPHQDGVVPIALHILTPPGATADTPVILTSGGADGWKTDLHDFFTQLALKSALPVVVFDIPGTGETDVPITLESVELVGQVIEYARGLGDGRVVHVGLSMGGFFSAATGLSGLPDGAVVCGGPVEATLAPGKHWAAGANHIIGNTLGFTSVPEPAELAKAMSALSLRPLLDRDDHVPMLAINGTEDVHIPLEDTLVFAGRRATEVVLLPDTGHCAVSKFDELEDRIIDWINRTFAVRPAADRATAGAAG